MAIRENPGNVQQTALKLLELFLGSCCFCDLQHIEPHSLAEGSALSDGDDVTHSHIPGGNGQGREEGGKKTKTN